MTIESTHENEMVVRRFLTALETLNVPTISDLVTDDIRWKVPGTLAISGNYDGKSAFVDGFLAGAAALFQAGSLAFDIRHITAVGDVVIAEYVGTGTSASTGAAYRNEYCVYFGLNNGRIGVVREYLDTAHVAEVLLSPAPA
ncbi:nuclear transport factor 2 family protein [Rhodococcus sovatensis]|uniref:Nuclear transport factor 2 family protein n=1 Tax=Rhodococcus sovatensis TaxID=1805840 RepID=A0ABZ2PI02_9NOCA